MATRNCFGFGHIRFRETDHLFPAAYPSLVISRRPSHIASMSEEEIPKATPDPGALRLKKKEPAAQPEHVQKKPPPQKKAEKSSKKKRKKRSRATLAKYLVRTFGCGLLMLTASGLFLAHQIQEWGLIPNSQAIMARNLTLAAFFILLILEAFYEDLLQGVLSLFLLPYSVVYGVFISESGAIRGLTVAVLLFLGAEMYLTPDEAVVPKVQKEVNSWIRSGQDKLIYPDGRPQAGFE